MDSSARKRGNNFLRRHPPPRLVPAVNVDGARGTSARQRDHQDRDGKRPTDPQADGGERLIGGRNRPNTIPLAYRFHLASLSTRRRAAQLAVGSSMVSGISYTCVRSPPANLACP